MNRFILRGVALVMGLGAFCFLWPSWSEQITVSITGTVQGADGIARDTERGSSSTSKTTKGGVFHFSNFPAGIYEVKAEPPGFETAVQPPITLVLNQTARVDFKMNVGAATNNVQATSEVPQTPIRQHASAWVDFNNRQDNLISSADKSSSFRYKAGVFQQPVKPVTFTIRATQGESCSAIGAEKVQKKEIGWASPGLPDPRTLARTWGTPMEWRHPQWRLRLVPSFTCRSKGAIVSSRRGLAKPMLN